MAQAACGWAGEQQAAKTPQVGRAAGRPWELKEGPDGRRERPQGVLVLRAGWGGGPRQE